MKYDFCVTINGINLEVLIPLFIGTFLRVVDYSQLHIHILFKKDVPENIRTFISNELIRVGATFTIYDVDYFTEETGPSQENVFWMAGDTALTCSYIMKNCGQSNWKFISHFDVVFYKNFVSVFDNAVNADVAMVGRHNMGLVLLNKIACEQMFIGFQSITGYYAVPLNDGSKGYKIIHGSDPLCFDKSIRIEGFDVLELMELNMRGKGWNTKLINVYEFLYHIVAGSGYHGNDSIAMDQRQRALSLLQANNLQPL